MLRALPLMIETAACMSPLQFKSGSLMVAISSTCAAVTLPTFTFCPLAEPALTPARSFSRNEAGGVFSSSVKLLSCARERQRGVSKDTHVHDTHVKDGDSHGDDLPHFVRGLGVVLLAEGHDVHALTKR